MRVAYKILADGSNITELIADRLLLAQITDEAGVKSDRLLLVIDDRDERLEAPKKGAKLEVSLGYVGKALVRMGSYVVDEVEFEGPALQMTIQANAVDMTKGIRSPKERSWPGVTLGTLVRKIAADNDLKPAISPELAARNLGHIDQTESDMQLLQRICTEQGATCKVADGRLVVATRAGGKAASGAKLPPATIEASSCASWSATMSDRNKYKAVKAHYHDVAKGKRVSVTAGSGKPVMTLKNSHASKDEAKRAAESKLKALSTGAGEMRISAMVGDPEMSAERIATLKGFRKNIDGDGWVVNSVTHTFNGDGYTCDVELESKG
jgi:uncharacterized protein